MNPPGKLQQQVQAVIDELAAADGEIGLQVAVLHRGRTVVDAVAGTADERTGEPVTPGTLFFAASAAKGVASSVVHVLADRGELAYDQRVADVWPEFGVHGKDGYSTACPGSTRPRPGSTFGMAGSNGSAVYADIDSGVVLAVLRNHVVGDFAAVSAISDLVTDHYQ